MGIKEFAKRTKTDPISLMKEIGGTQFAGVYTTINKSDFLQNRFFVAEIVDASDAREKIEKVVQDFGSTGKAKDSQPTVEYSVDAKNSFEIYSLPISNMAESLFGKAFSGINGNYLTIYRKYLIWGDNLPGIKSYLQNLVAEKTLANDSVYKVFAKNNMGDANFYVYGKVPKIFRLKDALLKKEISSSLSASEEVIRKFSTFSWQYSASGKMVEHKISLKYDPNFKEEPEAIWQLKLDAPLAQMPKLVLNHKDPANREVIVTDKENNVYLVDKEGVVLWKLKLPEPIISEIHQIDLYRNNRFQYLFNTKTQLYVIDRTGSKVGKFPVVFKSMAANGVSIAEYGQNKEYRFFVAGEDNKVYIYDRDGKLIPKWNFEGTESAVKLPIRHFDVDGKDYLVVSDKRNTYFLDRQGKLREGQPSAFDRSDNPLYFSGSGLQSLISTDQSGKIHIQDFSGSEEIKEVGKFGAAHRFAVEDIDGNGTMEYLFAEGKKLSVFATGGTKLFERSFPDAISEIPFICSFGATNNSIGIVTGAQNKLYLFDKKGGILRGFPLEGNTSFVLGKFNNATSYFNLLVGSEGGFLVNYKVE
jgi:WD40 repeat protein